MVYVGLFAVLLGAAAIGIRRLSPWARGPVVVLQILLGLLGYTTAFEADRPLIGLSVLLLVGNRAVPAGHSPEARWCSPTAEPAIAAQPVAHF